jgi:hypothetical protein
MTPAEENELSLKEWTTVGQRKGPSSEKKVSHTEGGSCMVYSGLGCETARQHGRIVSSSVGWAEAVSCQELGTGD